MRLALCLSLLAAPCLAGEAATPVSVGGFASPESVLLVGDHAYVSNIGPVLDPLAKDGDGFISLLAADGTVLARHALPADGTRLDAPKGMARIGGTLYVADIDRVVGFDLASGARLSVAELPGGDPSLANDLAAEPGGTLLVSDTLRNALYRLDPETGIWTLLTDGLPGANGIAIRPDGGIVVVGVGAGFAGGDTYALREGRRRNGWREDRTGCSTGWRSRPTGPFLCPTGSRSIHRRPGGWWPSPRTAAPRLSPPEPHCMARPTSRSGRMGGSGCRRCRRTA